MKINLTEQFKNHLGMFLAIDEKGQMINIAEVYENYGRPRFYSPRRRLKARMLRMLTELLIKRHNYEIEKVIRFEGKNVYVCFELAFDYLRELDIDNSIAINDYLLERGALDYFFSHLHQD
jgi:hypothetical protein